MITPNFDRLAKKSVVFDYAYTQIAVCNPARDSLLTGLRPDTVGTYGFTESFRPSMILPTHLNRVGYNTASYGKIIHWETPDKDIWSFDHSNLDWYIYQSYESDRMNSSVMPDKHTPEEKFRDYLFATKAIKTLRALDEKPQPFMLGIGFKMPHLSLHVPYKYYEMYKGKQQAWKLTAQELSFPRNTTSLAYRCCAEMYFRYMKDEGDGRATSSQRLGHDIDYTFTGI